MVAENHGIHNTGSRGIMVHHGINKLAEVLP